MRRFDLRSLRFDRSDAASRRLTVEVDPFVFGGESYAVPDDRVDLSLDVSRVGTKLVIQARFATRLNGVCARCLEDVDLPLEAGGVEYVAGGESRGTEDGEDPYVRGYQLQADRWARDLLADRLPAQLLCRPDCRGLCPECGANLNEVGDGHSHGDVAGVAQS
ncbi:MAG TPA: DUF177 domain-containing protein [Thermoleophilia bacterium]|nr:DUF177 domain-containing protein [Thermoleophilia bacterium]